MFDQPRVGKEAARYNSNNEEKNAPEHDPCGRFDVPNVQLIPQINVLRFSLYPGSALKPTAPPPPSKASFAEVNNLEFKQVHTCGNSVFGGVVVRYAADVDWGRHFSQRYRRRSAIAIPACTIQVISSLYTGQEIMDVQGAPPKRNVAIFLDMENLFGGYKGDVTSVPIGSIVREVEKVVKDRAVGSLTALVRAYANWGRADMAAYRREMLENGVEPVQIFSFNQNVKNAADIELVVDVLEVAAESPWVDVFVIVSGDGGFVPLIRRLHVLGKYAIVVTTSSFDSGGVSKLLRSVADHFHVIKVPDGPPAVAPATASTTAPDKPSTSRALSAPSPVPTIEEYKDTINSLIRDNPNLLVGGLVEGARLGPLLRKRWPGGDYRNFGYRTLGPFVEEHCGRTMFRPNGVKAAESAAPASVPIGKYPIVVQDRSEYIDAVRHLFDQENHLHREVLSMDRQGLPLSVIDLRLPTLVSGRTYSDLGYPDLQTMLRHALSTTELNVAPSQVGDVVLPKDQQAGREAYQSIRDDDLRDPELVRHVLGAVEPRVTYPEPMVLSLVLNALQPVSQPLEVAELIDLLADELSEISAEEIRFCLGLLWEVRVLVSKEGQEEGHLSVRESIDIVEDGQKIVVADALRRAEEIDWPVDEESIEYIIY